MTAAIRQRARTAELALRLRAITRDDRRRYVTIDGETNSIAGWSRASGVPERTIWSRLARGIEGAAIIAQKPQPTPKAPPTPPDPAKVVHLPMLSPPATRAECVNGPRPCRATLCRLHLLYGESTALPLEEMRETCSLDVADRGGVTNEEVAELLGLTKQRVSQIELEAVSKAKKRASSFGLDAWRGEALGTSGDPEYGSEGTGGGSHEELSPFAGDEDGDRWARIAHHAARAYEARVEERARMPRDEEAEEGGGDAGDL